MATSLTPNVTPVYHKPRHSLWKRILERPQQVWLRKAMFQIHLWAGVIAGLYVVMIGVSGSILVFKEELLPRPSTSVGHTDLRACTPNKLLGVVDRVKQAYPDKEAFLTACPTEANPLFVTTLREKPKVRSGKNGSARQRTLQISVFSHPETGEIVGNGNREDSWVEWIENLHVNLLLGRSGRLWNGIGASVLLALTITGIVLWWPGVRTWKRALALHLKRSWKRINWDLHSMMGFWTVFFTLMWATTGMYFTWPAVFTKVIKKISPIVNGQYPGEEMRKLGQRPPTQLRPLDLAAVLAEAKAQSPDGYLEGYFYGNGPKPILTVYMARERMGDYSNTDFLYFDQNTGKHLLTWHRGQNQTLGDWLMWLIAPLHFGTSWGPIGKWAWFFLGLVLPLLTITGFLMYWNRFLGKQWQSFRG